MIPLSEHVLMFCSCIAEHLGNGYGNAFDVYAPVLPLKVYSSRCIGV